MAKNVFTIVHNFDNSNRSSEQLVTTDANEVVSWLERHIDFLYAHESVVIKVERA